MKQDASTHAIIYMHIFGMEMGQVGRGINFSCKSGVAFQLWVSASKHAIQFPSHADLTSTTAEEPPHGSKEQYLSPANTRACSC